MSGERKNPRRETTLVQMLSLHLLMLAFFVLLYNHSRIEDAKSKAVAGSIHATFADKGVNSDQPVPVTSLLADALAEAEFQRQVGKLVKTEIPIAEVDVVKRGRLMRARMPTTELFDKGAVRLKADRSPLLRRIAGMLSDSPAGLRYDLEVIIGSPWITPKMLGQRTPIEVARASNIGIALQGAGAPPGNVAVGIRQGEQGWVNLHFHVRSEDEGRLTLPVPVEEGGDE